MEFNNCNGHFLGKNGFFKASGIDLQITADNKHVIISPITSKNKIGRCEMWIPVSDIENLIAELYEIIPEDVQQYFPITSVHREDLKEYVVEPDKISSSNMKILAERMEKSYCDNLFWDSLECESEKLKGEC